MSASLVGSEMCIRDRSTLGCDATKDGGAQRGRVNRGPRREVRPGSVLASVSYTHLTLPTICSV
eukprot:1608946-Alexandrium_andersonii.AAC.1